MDVLVLSIRSTCCCGGYSPRRLRLDLPGKVQDSLTLKKVFTVHLKRELHFVRQPCLLSIYQAQALHVTRTETPNTWPPDAKSQFIGKRPRLGKTEGKRSERGGRGCSKCHPEQGAVTIRILSQKGLRYSPHHIPRAAVLGAPHGEATLRTTCAQDCPVSTSHSSPTYRAWAFVPTGNHQLTGTLRHGGDG